MPENALVGGLLNANESKFGIKRTRQSRDESKLWAYLSVIEYS